MYFSFFFLPKGSFLFNVKSLYCWKNKIMFSYYFRQPLKAFGDS